ncbi:MAG: EVE domain-containing protein [Bacteroidetes bacterium]|nr:EVE domain-containing protein [Bacteroidota bacterium]MBP6402868.1 EVE domain-containing protein [Bacteroidia bacterium]
MNYWLVKSDPDTYSWQDLLKDGKTSWDGVRNYAARIHLRGMKKGDLVLVYHSGGESVVLGIASISKEYYQDPTTKDDAWVSVELKAVKALTNGVTLKQIKSEKSLKDIALIKISRLSVMPIRKEEYDRILEMSDGD